MKNGTGLAEEEGEGEDGENEGDSHEGALEFAMLASIKSLLAKGNGFAEPHDGVRKALGITENQI